MMPPVPESASASRGGQPGATLRTASPLVSLIVPVYDEETSIDSFITDATRVMNALKLPFELLFVNDGSRDQTLAQLVARSATNPAIRVVNLSRNFQKEAALTAGLDYARGDVVVPIDVDLQDPPELIGRFVELWREGYDVVYGLRASRDSDDRAKRTTSKLFYRFFNYLSPIKIPADVGDFRLMDRRVVEVLKMLPERNRFMKGLFAWVGFRSIGVPYERVARHAGTTKWNYWRLWNFALDGVFSFSTLPLRIWIYVGIISAATSFLYAIFIILRVIILGVDVPGYASLMTVVLFMGGIQLMSLGIIGEYLGRLFLEVKRRPIYLVDGVFEGGAVKLPQEVRPIS
jgi:glycosyltransferase involved in cell wall biosynthesis